MKRLETIVLLILVGFIGWQSAIVNSAVIVQNGAAAPPALHKDQSDEANFNIRVFQEAMSDYAELSHAYNAPAKDEAAREKRTIGVFRNLANRTRAGFATVRTLFSGLSGGSSGSGGSGSGFRTFFSNLLNRMLVFLTNLWDRITGLFRRDGANGGGGGFFARIMSLFSGGAGGGGLFSIFRPTTTTENYFPDSDFSYDPSSTTTTEKEKDFTNIDDAVGSNSIVENKGKSLDDEDGNDAANDDFIPFPGDSELNSRTGKKLEQLKDTQSPVALAVSSDVGKDSGSSPHVVNSPSVIHLIDDGRRFGI